MRKAKPNQKESKNPPKQETVNTRIPDGVSELRFQENVVELKKISSQEALHQAIREKIIYQDESKKELIKYDTQFNLFRSLLALLNNKYIDKNLCPLS